MRNYLYTAVATVVAGCATTNPAAMQTAETAAEYMCMPLAFPVAVGCVRAQFDANYPGWQRDANADLVNIFLAWGTAAGTRVGLGELSDADAKQQAQTLHARLNQIAYNRQLQRQINSEMAANFMLAGLAVMAAAQPSRPVYGAPITCTVMGNSRLATVNCF